MKIIAQLATSISNGTFSDDDLKLIGDALAARISSGKSSPRIATSAARAVKKSLKSFAPPREPRPVNNFYRLSRHALSLAEGLQFWADGTVVPESPDERQYALITRDASASIIVNYRRLGVDVTAILDTFLPESLGHDQKNY